MRLNSPQINLITKACLKASRSLIRDFGEIENLQVSTKAPGDFVSSADKRTEKILINELQKAHPDYGIVTEESGIINNPHPHQTTTTSTRKHIGGGISSGVSKSVASASLICCRRGVFLLFDGIKSYSIDYSID